MEYTLAEYRMVSRYTESLRACYAALVEMKENDEYKQLAESNMDHTVLQLMFYVAREIGYMDALKEEIMSHIRNA